MAASKPRNPLVRFEIAGRDGPALERFYGELFDWTIASGEIGGHRYAEIDTGGPGPGAGIRHEPDGEPEIVLYVEVPDLEAAIDRARSLGATVRIPPLLTPNVLFALITDPEGNPVGLVEAVE